MPTTTAVLAFLTILVLITSFYFYTYEGDRIRDIPPTTEYTTTTTSVISPFGNCGDLQIDINTIIEATNYYRFDIQKPAADNHKFEIFELTLTNRGEFTKDFSGYRIELVADNESYIPLRFNNIEKVILPEDSILDYSCEELALAYISRFELDPEESATGCKIFQILEDFKPESLSIYDLEGLKCRIPIE